MNKIFLFSITALLVLGTIGIFIFLNRTKSTNSNIPSTVSTSNNAPVQKNTSEIKIYSGIISGVSNDSLLLTSGSLQLKFNLPAETIITGPNSELVKKVDLLPGLSVDVSARDMVSTSIKVKDFPYFIIASPAPSSPIDLGSIIKGSVKYESGYLYYKIVNRRTQSVYSDSKLELTKAVGSYSPFSLSMSLNTALDLIDQDNIDITLSDSSDLLVAKNITTLPYIYNGGLASKIKIYIGSSKSECGMVAPVERLINAAKSPIRSSIEEIIKGPSDTEKTKGYFSPISNLTAIRSLDLRDGVLYLDFNQNALENLITSCDIATAKSEITQTIKQFISIKTIVISVNSSLKNSLN